jgi:hypothetical protein
VLESSIPIDAMQRRPHDGELVPACIRKITRITTALTAPNVVVMGALCFCESGLAAHRGCIRGERHPRPLAKTARQALTNVADRSNDVDGIRVRLATAFIIP